MYGTKLSAEGTKIITRVNDQGIYAVRSIRGNTCSIMDLQNGEQDIEMTKAEVMQYVRYNHQIIGCTDKEVNLFADVVAYNLKNYKNLDCDAMRGCKIRFVGDWLASFIDAKLEKKGSKVYTIVDLNNILNARKILGYLAV